MSTTLPKSGYLSLPMQMERGRLATCDLDDSIRSYIRLNLNVPVQGSERPRWLTADPSVGCRVPHYDFQAVIRALHLDTGAFVTAIRQTIEACEPRIERVDVEVEDLGPGDHGPESPGSGSQHTRRIRVLCERTDGQTQALQYLVIFGGAGPVFDR